MIEQLTTEKLLLRRPTLADLPAYVAYYASDWRATHGPVMQAPQARQRFARILEHWKTHGYGRFVAERLDQPVPIGLFGPHWPDAYPEAELTGQIWTRDALGEGLGLEAMRAVRRHAYEQLGWTTAITYIHPENARAVRLARSMHARIDPSVHAPASLDGHDAWRHPDPEELAGLPRSPAPRRRHERVRNVAAPTLRTPRLLLRPFRIEDFDTYAAFLGSPRAVGLHGPHSREAAWAWFTNDVASWTLFGHGGLMIEVAGRPVGQVSITCGPTFPEPELGWFLFDGAEGNGYATEAALALRQHAYEVTGLDTLVSYCSRDNAASIAVAERLGCVLDEAAPRPAGVDCLVFRHPGADAEGGGMEAYA